MVTVCVLTIYSGLNFAHEAKWDTIHRNKYPLNIN